MIRGKAKRVIAWLLTVSMLAGTNGIPAFAASRAVGLETEAAENATGSAITNEEETEEKQELPEDTQDKAEENHEPTEEAVSEPQENNGSQGVRMIETKYGNFTVSGSALTAYNATGGAIAAEVVIPDGEGITEIGDNVFKGNTDITALSMPDTITKIGRSAFEHATTLKDITYSNALKELGERAFYGCTSLLSVNLSKTELETIGDSAFYGCTKMVLINFPDHSLRKIGKQAFSGCTSVISVDFPNTVTEIGEYAFRNCIKLESIELPSKLEVLGQGAFYSCTAAKNVTIPSSLEVIPEDAFWGCTRLVNLEVKRGVKKIGARAFNTCTALSFADFPNTIKEVGEEAFANCSMLRVLIIRGDVENVGIDAFRGTNTNLTVYGYINDKTTLREAVTVVAARTFVNLEDRSDKKKLKLWNTFTSSNKDKNHGQINAYYVEEEEKKDSDKKPVYDEDGNVKKVEKKYKITESTNLQSGMKIYLDIIPNKDYRLAEESLRFNGKLITNIMSGHDKEGDSDKVELDDYYYFTMPNFNVVITAEFERGKDESGIDGTGIELLNNGDLTLEKDGVVPVYSMKKTQKIKLVMLDSTYGTRIPNNKLVYSVLGSETKRSNDYVELDEYGNLTAKKATPSSSEGTSIYAWVRGYKASTRISFKLKIIGTTVEKVEFDLSDGESYGTVSEASDMITFNKEDVETKISFEAVANGIDKDGDILNVDYDWSVVDEKVAKLSDSKTNKNTIKIVGEGTTIVKATTSVKSGSSTKKIEGHFTIQVVDVKPKCNTDSVTLNPYLSNGAEISIIPFEGYEVRKNDKFGVNIYEEDGSETDKFILKAGENNQYYIEAADPLMKTGTYKMTIRGQYKKLTAQSYSGIDVFNYKLKVTVKKSLPSVSLSLKGTKIDAFYQKEYYNGRKPEDLIQVVDNLKTDKISKYEFIPLESSDSEKQEEYNHFATYFEIVTAENGKKYLKQVKDFVYDEKGNPVGLSGYIRIWFEGYKEYSDEECKTYKDIKITLPVNKGVPGYVLSSKKGTVNNRYTSENGQLIALKLYNSSKEKKIIDFTSEAKLVQDTDTSKVALIGTLNDKNSGSYIDPETNIIYLRVAARDKQDGGKITFGIADKGWNRPISFTYSLTVSDKTPKVSFSPATVTLNSLSPDVKVPVELAMNQIADGILDSSQKVVFMESNSASKAAYNAYGQRLEEILNRSYHTQNHSFEAMLPAGEAPVTGSYKFKCIVNEGSSDVLNTITLTIKVVQKPAQISGLTGTYTLNSQAEGEISYKEKEYKKAVKNMPDGYDVAGTPEVIGANANSMNAADQFDFEITTGSAIRLNISKTGRVGAGTYKFKVTPKMFSAGNQAGSDMKEFTVTVKVISKTNNEMSASLKKKTGSLNPIDRDNGLFYTVSFKNVSDVPKADGITVKEGQAVSQRFKASYDPEKGLVHLQMIPGAEISTKSTYNLTLGFELENTDLTVYTKNMKLKPAMVKPKLTIDNDERKLYKSNVDVVQRIEIKEEKLKTEVIPEIAEIQLAGDPKKTTYLNAFKVQYNKATNSVEVSLVKEQTGYLVSGQTYSLKCNVIYQDNPMTKEKDGKTTYDVGSTITVKIKINN